MSHSKFYTTMTSPLGEILLAGNEQQITDINFQEGTHPLTLRADWCHDHEVFAAAIAQLQAYFAGELQTFDLLLAPAGTPFQQTVWQALQTIPYGETISYAELAERIGNPKAVRAVGAANGRNPIPIIIPCHRVIGSNGQLTGYGGGLPIKEALLSLERDGRILVNPQLSLFDQPGS
jgi:methylated-DNA-[protein]-cysteine S-methyltransferase